VRHIFNCAFPESDSPQLLLQLERKRKIQEVEQDVVIFGQIIEENATRKRSKTSGCVSEGEGGGERERSGNVQLKGRGEARGGAEVGGGEGEGTGGDRGGGGDVTGESGKDGAESVSFGQGDLVPERNGEGESAQRERGREVNLEEKGREDGDGEEEGDPQTGVSGYESEDCISVSDVPDESESDEELSVGEGGEGEDRGQTPREGEGACGTTTDDVGDESETLRKQLSALLDLTQPVSHSQIEGLIHGLDRLKAQLSDLDDSRPLLSADNDEGHEGQSQEFSQSVSQMQSTPFLEAGKPSQRSMSGQAKDRGGFSKGFQFPLLPPRPGDIPLPLVPSPQPPAPSLLTPVRLS